MFLLPGFAGVLLFYLLPFFEAVRRSFLKSGNSAFVGMDNYRTVFENRQGVINGVLTHVSEKIAAFPAFAAIDYLNTEWALVVVVCSFLWKNTGYMVILWLAGLAALPKEVEEAAQVDGANRWQSWHYIIRPGLSGSFFTIGMLSVLQIFKSYREVWMVAGSYPQEHIYFLQHLLQNWYLKLEFDRMAALTVILSLVLLVVCLLLQKRMEPER